MARPAVGGRPICESCMKIDVREWHRNGQLKPGHLFAWSWTCNGEPWGSINVLAYKSELVLMFQSDVGGAPKSVKQRVPIARTSCHLGGRRPWFICTARSNGKYCGRRVAVLYGAGELFACRHCCGLAYASQEETVTGRGLMKVQRIRMRLGGSPNMSEPFPNRPKGMHSKTYKRIRDLHDATAARAMGMPLRAYKKVWKARDAAAARAMAE